jgi:hypothetical protein
MRVCCAYVCRLVSFFLLYIYIYIYIHTHTHLYARTRIYWPHFMFKRPQSQLHALIYTDTHTCSGICASPRTTIDLPSLPHTLPKALNRFKHAHYIYFRRVNITSTTKDLPSFRQRSATAKGRYTHTYTHFQTREHQSREPKDLSSLPGYTYIYIYIYIYIYSLMSNIQGRLLLPRCLYVYMCVCICVCLCVCIYVYMYMRIGSSRKAKYLPSFQSA